MEKIVRQRYAELRRRETQWPRNECKWFPEKRGLSAQLALAAARDESRPIDGFSPYRSESIWTGPGSRGAHLTESPVSPCDGQTFEAYGARLRWIEKPESKGLRFVGLAHDVPGAYVEHTGWFMDEDGFGETVAGVVYQLPGAKGQARFVAGYADPHNCDKRGRGPACLDLSTIYTADCRGDDSAWQEAAADAARDADSIAEKMAEQERELQESEWAGREVRSLFVAARDACRDWANACRDLRRTFKARHAAGLVGLSPDDMRATIRGKVEYIRRACDDWQTARRDAHSALWDKAPAYPVSYFNPAKRADQLALIEAFRQGYSEGKL